MTDNTSESFKYQKIATYWDAHKGGQGRMILPSIWYSAMQKAETINHEGFTLIEIVAILVLLGILSSFTVSEFLELDATATQRALLTAVNELNSRERLTWARIKTSETSWLNDEQVFAEVNTYLGSDYRWNPPAHIDGGNLHFKKQIVNLKRVPSTISSAGHWQIED